jgi:hypothetical protein
MRGVAVGEQIDRLLHSPSDLCTARPFASRFAVHYAPKHGSWLNQADSEISIIELGCLLSRPVGDLATLQGRVAALECERNGGRCTIHWQFTACQARTKLVRVSPHRHPAGS